MTLRTLTLFLCGLICLPICAAEYTAPGAAGMAALNRNKQAQSEG